MDVTIIATRTCHHRHVLERQLQALGVPYRVQWVDDDPHLVGAYALRSSPSLLVDGALVFRAAAARLPTEAELRACLGL